MNITRTERQKQCIKNWITCGGQNTVVAATGVGKTRIGVMAIQLLLSKKPDAQILVVVPTDVLKKQWLDDYIIPLNLFYNVTVEIINTVIRQEASYDLVIQDECHKYASETFKRVFEVLDYSFILCLTATLERLDGKEEIIKQYAPVCDTITMDEAMSNGWISPIKEYAVMLDVDLTEYNNWNRKFNGYFAAFDYQFDIAMKCAVNAIERNKFAKKMGLDTKTVAANAMGFMRAMKKRKDFVMSHPKKLEVARRILEARKDKKCITFSATIKDAESIGMGYVLHSKQSKKKNKEVLDAFNSSDTGILCSSKAADQGLDVRGLSVGIILSTDSSKTRKTQRSGRVGRFEEGKTAEMFTLLIKGTQEVNWHRNSANPGYIVINEEQLDRVLAGETVETRPQEQIENKKYRF